jgi:hypothetical protein
MLIHLEKKRYTYIHLCIHIHTRIYTQGKENSLLETQGKKQIYWRSGIVMKTGTARNKNHLTKHKKESRYVGDTVLLGKQVFL